MSKCSDGEKTKYIGYGTLVLIPAITGIFSMTYAISTITQNTTVIVFAAIIWFFFILFVDRFIVSTLYKSKYTNIWTYIVSVSLRYLFATFVGITVAHPLVLLVFNKNILEKVYADKRNLESNEIGKRDSLKKDATVELSNLYNQRDCFNKLLQAEKNGYRLELECGFTSGDKGESTSFALAQKQLDSLQNLITKIENKTTTQTSEIGSRYSKDSADIEKGFSTDYLKRVNTLKALESIKGNEHIETVEWFLILFFIFIDILPITMKIATPYGEYERHRDNKISELSNKYAGKEAAYTQFYNNEYITTETARFQFQNKNNEIKDITRNTMAFLTSIDEIKEEFFSYLKKLETQNEKINDTNQRDFFKNQIISIRDIFNQSYAISLEKYKETLREI